MVPSPAAGSGKATGTKTPTKLTRKPQDQGSASDSTPKAPQAPKIEKPDVEESAEDVGKKAPSTEDAGSKVEMKDSSEAGDTDDLEPQEPKPLEEEEDGAPETEGTETTADDATEKAGDTVSESADGVKETAQDATEGAKKTASGLASGAGKLAKGDTEGATDDAKGAAEDTTDAAEGATGDVKDTAEGATGQELPKVPGLEILKGLEVDEQGLIHDKEGSAVGRLVEGDAEDLVGYTIGDDGEILDDDGDLVGRCEILPEKVKELESQAKEEVGDAADNIPGLEILEGFTVDAAGNVLNDDGDTIGQLVSGNPKELMGKTFNSKGEILDDEGKVIGRARVHPDAAQFVDDTAEDAEEGAEDVQDTAEGAVDETGEAIDDELPGIEALEGHEVNSQGEVLDSEGNLLANLAEGDAADVKGLSINEKGEVIDAEGNVVGKVELADGAKEILAGVAPTLKILENLKVNKKGKILDSEGEVIGELVDGDPAQCAGKKANERGEILDKSGAIIGRVKVVPGDAANEAMKEIEDTPDQVEEGTFVPGLDILEGLKVNKKGAILNEEGEPIGELVDGDIEKCAGAKCNDKGEVLDKDGKVIGRVRTLPQQGEENEGGEEEAGAAATEETQEPEEAEEEDDGLPPLSILEGLKVNKAGKLINDKGVIVGELVSGDAKKLSKLGTTADAEGQFWDTKGHVIGKAKTVPVEDADEEGAFAGLEGLIVTKDGMVEDENKNIVGKVVEGDPKKLVGRAVDEDGDIIDKKGSVVGHAERYEEPDAEEAPEIDLSSLAGCTVNKAGNVVDSSGTIRGKVAEGDVKNMIGRKVDGKGQIWDSGGNVIGRAELVEGVDTSPDGPFSGFENATVAKDGTVRLGDDTIIGRIIEGDVKKLVGHKVDEDGDISDKNGNSIGKAERWEPEEKERKINPMAGKRVNKEGEVRDENGDLMGRLTAGDLGHCVGLEIDDNGYVVDNDGQRVGEVTLLENIAEESEELTEDEQKKKQDAELAEKMANICQQTLERVQPVMKQITEYIEQADRTPRDELDEEELVNNVKPLIEEGSRILQECNGSLRGLDPDGHIAAQAKGRAATREATPEEYRLADLLKELTTTVVTTIDNAKKKISDMPHAKKKLNPLWALLTEPLFQIIAAVGLLLSGVLGLVGQLLNALGLGGLVNGLLGGLGIDKLLGGLGLGGITDGLFGGKKDKKKGGGAKSLPLVGGLLGGGK